MEITSLYKQDMQKFLLKDNTWVYWKKSQYIGINNLLFFIFYFYFCWTSIDLNHFVQQVSCDKVRGRRWRKNRSRAVISKRYKEKHQDERGYDDDDEEQEAPAREK